ncbi:MAG: TonB-dependent receptor [Acidobacteriales bacterium]|nr:TonB-dependent receptor [Terriglobales bacterium]
MQRIRSILFMCAAPFLFFASTHAQELAGDLRINVTDVTGSGLQASVQVSTDAQHLQQFFQTDPQGQLTLKHLRLGVYRLTIQRPGFSPESQNINLDSQAPQPLRIVLKIASEMTSVEVSATSLVLDVGGIADGQNIGRSVLNTQSGTSPGRQLIEAVNSQPGWLLEADGVLHPRGSEYGTLFVLDGFPLSDNRSPAFAPATDADDPDSIRVMTSSFAAEYGRKLGGVVEVNSRKDFSPGFHGTLSGQAGSFATGDTSFTGHYAASHYSLGLNLSGFRTDRYLDPPSLENFTNEAQGRSASASLDVDLNSTNNIRLTSWRGHTDFLVPNDPLQQQAGQLQSRSTQESGGNIAYRHLFTPNLLGAVRFSARDLTARLDSNPQSTPMLVTQDRGFREYYSAASLSGHIKHHEWKIGVDNVRTSIREQFGYHLTDPASLDSDLPANFEFLGAHIAHEQSAYIQDALQWRAFSMNVGLRWDHYSFLVSDQAFSPRLGLGWRSPISDLFFYASYDRAFSTPAFENLLLSSSQAAQSLTGNSSALPIPTSRGDFYEVGLRKVWFSRARLDANYFVRDIRNFADDDVLLNTGVSIPISFSRARIKGIEAKLDIPQWGRFSGFLSYSNQIGIGTLPITGGLLFDVDAESLLRSHASFAISQDQRNTAHAVVRYRSPFGFWIGGSGAYGSGLPVELGENFDPAKLNTIYSAAILERVNFAAQRVRPSSSLDISAGSTLWTHESRALRLQGDIGNITNKLNVINFAGLLSGTALGMPRHYSLKAELAF